MKLEDEFHVEAKFPAVLSEFSCSVFEHTTIIAYNINKT
jgi:hypothetical protein